MLALFRSMPIIALVLISGCAHKINLTPPLNTLDKGEKIELIQKNVGYYISNEDRLKEVETSGGGGDKVKYTPYVDIEPALKYVLSNTFANVYKISSLDDFNFIEAKNISYIFVPSITTESSSSSAFTWPPTDFSISLQCRAINSVGDNIWEREVQGKGHAEYEQFKHDFSLSARKAIINALLKLEVEIRNSEELK